jgi:threonine/homoserine/homoserine lactone efflux protein
MHSTLSLNSMVALFVSMLVLAAIPSVSVLTVTARSATAGFMHGAATTIGIVAGDIIFISIAILGLSALTEVLGDMFVLVKYLGGAYLVWLAINLWRMQAMKKTVDSTRQDSLFSSLLSGLFITLGDQKAILFYLGFFPAFLDLSVISIIDTCIIIIIVTVAVGGVKLGYALIASKAGLLTGLRSYRVINIIAGCILFASGLFLIARP